MGTGIFGKMAVKGLSNKYLIACVKHTRNTEILQRELLRNLKTFEFRFYVPLDTKWIILERFFLPISWLVLKKLKTTQQKQTFIQNTKILQHKINTD